MSSGRDESDSQTPRQSVAVDIAAPNRISDYTSILSGDSFGSSNLFVGSPGQADRDASSTPRISRIPSFESPGASPVSRPRLGYRTLSSSAARTGRPSTRDAPRSTSGFLRLHPGSTPHERQWSLFGQLMENEGQLRSPGLRRVRQKASNTALSAARSSSVSRLSSAPSSSAPDPVSPAESAAHALIDGPYSPDRLSIPLTSSDIADYDESDPDYDSDASEDSLEESEAEPASTSSFFVIPTIPVLYKNILKCGIAYFIASLFTFVPYLSSFISDISSNGRGDGLPSPSGHMVATVAVYFNPAKTIGGMVEADLYCFMGLFFSAFICLCSMSLYWWLEFKEGWEWLADLLVILWIGAGMSGVAWMKVWMAKPSFNTACSMTAIILFVVIVKEGGLLQLSQVSFIVVMGSIVSNGVCYLIWPQSATTNLQESMIKTLDSFSTLLHSLTNTFLLEEPLHQPRQEKLQKAVENHQASFTVLKKNLAEAYSEWFYGGPRGYDKGTSGRAYEDAVDSLNRLGQHLNGLRSGTRLQYELAKAHSDGKVILKNRARNRRTGLSGSLSESVTITNDKGRDGGHGIATESGTSDKEPEEAEALLKAAAVMFGDLVDDLGPPLKALTTTCSSCLKRLREAFAQRQRTSRKQMIQPQEFHELIDGIERALFTFESTSNHAVMRLYRRSDISAAPSRVSVSAESEENQILTNENNENVFLVYFFIFTLQEFAQELVSLVDAMSRIYSIEQSRSGRWRRFWSKIVSRICSGFKSPSSDFTRKKGNRAGLRRHLSSYIHPHGRRNPPNFPKVRPHAPNTIQTPSWDALTFTGKVNQAIWALGARLQEADLKYAIKAGMATAMLAAPAFFDATRPVFVEYRGEWALISFFVVMSPTIGATNSLSVHRVLGTLFGAGVATGIYALFPHNPYVLSIFGFFFSLPCFYIIVAKPQYATTGRFVLLTYNLTCLYCYNLRKVDVSVGEVAFHRSAAVTVGVIWAALVSRFWWPAKARTELSKALGEFCLNMGWLYTRLVASNSFGPEVLEPEDNNQSSPVEAALLISTNHEMMTTKLNNSIQEFMAMELHLQIKLIELQGLLAQTQHEPRLKGPFPIQLYRSILTSLQIILDKLHSMRCVTTREEWYTTVRKDFIIPVNGERHEMVGNIILAFSMLSSAFRLKAPLPPYLPPAEKSRQRLVNAIRRLDVVKNRDIKGSKHLLFFAYALTMQGVTMELEKLGRTLQDAFGVIGQTPEFEALFAERSRMEQSV